jgi:hypothetical protein
MEYCSTLLLQSLTSVVVRNLEKIKLQIGLSECLNNIAMVQCYRERDSEYLTAVDHPSAVIHVAGLKIRV